MKKSILLIAFLLSCTTVFAQQFVSITGKAKCVVNDKVIGVNELDKFQEEEIRVALLNAYRYLAKNKQRAIQPTTEGLKVFDPDNYGKYIPIKEWIDTRGQKYGITPWKFEREANEFYNKFKKGEIK